MEPNDEDDPYIRKVLERNECGGKDFRLIEEMDKAATMERKRWQAIRDELLIAAQHDWKDPRGLRVWVLVHFFRTCPFPGIAENVTNRLQATQQGKGLVRRALVRLYGSRAKVSRKPRRSRSRSTAPATTTFASFLDPATHAKLLAMTTP